MIELVINADDLGLHPRIDEGIFAAHASGVVTSSTLLVTGPTASSATKRAHREKLPVGLHLCLTTHLTPAAKASEVRWLAPGGRFRRNWAELSVAWLSRLVPRAEVELEFRAQVDRARALGANIDHLDTHQHLHLLPGLTGIVEALAYELDVPVRWPRERPNAHWLRHPRSALKAALVSGLANSKPAGNARRIAAAGVFEAGRLSESRLLRLVEGLSDGQHEIACHPGYEPGVVKHDPTWRYEWETELSALTSPRVRAAIEARGISLRSYRELAAS
jgi:predicted glycoside hydrolase/deacetylase ChbG (UPF0249 family)